ncbi:hypothetical protein SAMN03097699_0317 [Flavobacteriaceae bacterium MAR_2010_188]|nr:hypothetical protein SAMN03097699_0317 [Flavobacteriaceae bacterium MAR_2010_188]
MKKPVLLLILAIFLHSCDESQFYESTWTDKETENVILNIEKKDGKFWLTQYDQSMEIVDEGKNSYATSSNFDIPLTLDSENNILTIRNVDYILQKNSNKGQFTGNWKNEKGEPSFAVQIDENNDLNWDFKNGDDKSARYYPKPTKNGFHFSIGQYTLSYQISDGFLIDNKGNKYSKDLIQN